MNNFYASAVAAIPPGPNWVHDIGLVGYDYWSQNHTTVGQGKHRNNILKAC